MNIPNQIELWPVERLKPYERNARTHDGDQVAKIAASIAEFGFTNPILVDSADGIIAGHGRLMAAMSLGLSEVPVIVLDHLTDAQRRAYILADNRLALDAGWDNAMLAAEIQALESDGFALELTGFTDEELADLLEPVEAEQVPEGDPDEVPEPPAQPVTVLGDVWVMGKHRLMCGSSTDIGQVETLIAGNKPDMVFTDPPYGIDVVSGGSVGGGEAFGSVGGNGIVAANAYSPIIGDDTTETAREFYNTCSALELKNLLIWGGNYFTDFLPPKKCWIIWDKKGRKWDDNFSDFEMAWSSYDKPAKILTFVWMGIVQTGEREKRVHPTQKPAQFVADCIEYLEPKAKIIYDGFGGSGSTLMACEKTGRNARLMELSPHYCDVIIKRWQDFTGKKATLEATGATFDAVAADRQQAFPNAA